MSLVPIATQLIEGWGWGDPCPFPFLHQVLGFPDGHLGQPLHPSRKPKHGYLLCSPKTVSFPRAGSQSLAVFGAISTCPGGRHLADRTHLHSLTISPPGPPKQPFLTLLEANQHSEPKCAKFTQITCFCRILIPEVWEEDPGAISKNHQLVFPSAGTSLIPVWSNMEWPIILLFVSASSWLQPFLHPQKQDVVSL